MTKRDKNGGKLKEKWRGFADKNCEKSRKKTGSK